MKINLITNFADRKGLWRDGCILERLLCGWGHTINRVQFNGREPAPKHADLNIFIETLRPDLFQLAGRNWWIPNPEWATPDDLAQLPHLDRVLYKTREAEALFTPLTDRAVYIGFESEDRYDPSVPREKKVLHIAGGSIQKGTQAVLDAWEQYALPYPLTVVGDEQVVKPRPIPNVTYRGWVDDAELKRLQNSHRVHLQPSETEGWGHTIHEGMSVGAMVVTIDRIADSICCEWLEHFAMRSFQRGRRCLAPLFTVSASEVAFAVHRAAEEDPVEWGRYFYLTAGHQFRQRLKTLLDAVA